MATSATAGGPGAHGKQAGAYGAKAAYGLWYGTKTSQPPTPAAVVDKYRSHGISKMWLSPTPLSPINQDVISILNIIVADLELKSNMKVVLYMDCNDFSLLADESQAKKWVATYISAKFVSVISHVCVGELIGPVDFTSSTFQRAISNFNKLLSGINLSILVKTCILLGDSYTAKTRPSASELIVSREDLLQFQSLFVRIMPYFRAIPPEKIPVDNCILKDGAPIYLYDTVDDTDYKYSQAFDATFDSICCALKKMDGLDKLDKHVVSGWPTDGPTEWASQKYAKQYISNLVQHIGKPTPMGNEPVDIFIYSMVDEDNLETSIPEFKHLGVEPYLP